MNLTPIPTRLVPQGAADRERFVEMLFERLHPLMAWLAALFVLVIVGEAVVANESPFATIFTVAGWVIWALFVMEFVVRLILAPSKMAFLRRNWWQMVFLVLPFLALARALMALRVARAGRLVSAALRGTRSAASGLRNRLAAVGAVTVMVTLLSANVLFEFAGITPYGMALHDAAYATISGEPISGSSAVARVMEIVLALYSVVVFAAVAGSVGAFFLERRAEDPEREARQAAS